MTEPHTIHLPVVRYRDKDGNHTCATDFKTGEVCEFYRTQRMGTWETCLFSPADGLPYHESMQRRTDEEAGPDMGTLIPGAWCPVWKES